MSGRTGYPDRLTDKQIHKLSKELLLNGADHDDVGRVRNMCQHLQDLKSGKGLVSAWIDDLLDDNPAVAGKAAMDCCRRADKHHFSTLARAKKEQAA